MLEIGLKVRRLKFHSFTEPVIPSQICRHKLVDIVIDFMLILLMLLVGLIISIPLPTPFLLLLVLLIVILFVQAF